MKFLIFYLALLQCGSVFSLNHESKEEYRTAELLDELYREALRHSEERRRLISQECGSFNGMPFYAKESDTLSGCEEYVAEVLSRKLQGTPVANLISEGEGVQVSREYRSISLPNDPEVLKREGLALVASFQHSPYSQQVGWWSCGSEYLPNISKIGIVCRRR